MGDEVTGRPAALGSALANLRDRREKALAKLHLDLAVPRYDPPVYVRFRPVDRPVIEDANKKAQESKDRDWAVVANAFVLAHACVGVFGEVDGKPEGNPEDWPTFTGIAELVDLPAESTATEVIRKLYLTDGDVIAAADRLTSWSAQVEERADEEFSGN